MLPAPPVDAMLPAAHLLRKVLVTSVRYGKYRGVVTDDADPLGIGRVRVAVPDVLPQRGVWALPCAPPAVPPSVPPVGSNVWVEFEQGDPDYPIWAGCFWTSAEQLPSGPPDEP